MKLKSLFASAVTVAAALAAGQATAAVAQEFCVDALGLGWTHPSNSTQEAVASPRRCVNSDVSLTGIRVTSLDGAYAEKLLITGATTFKSTTVLKFNSMSLAGANAIQYGPNQSGLGNGYELYALVYADGTYNSTTGAFAATSATLEVYADKLIDVNDYTLNGISGTLNMSAQLGFTGDADSSSQLLASSTALISGAGVFDGNDSSSAADGYAVLFGDLSLTTAGQAYFIAPRPFHIQVFSDGDISTTNLDPVLGARNLVAGGQAIELSGEANAVFPVPEPGSLALLGMGLAGLGFAARRRKA